MRLSEDASAADILKLTGVPADLLLEILALVNARGPRDAPGARTGPARAPCRTPHRSRMRSQPSACPVEAGQELVAVLEVFLANPSAADARTDIFYAREKLTLAVTGWAHWEENGRELLEEVHDAAGAVEYGRQPTLDAVKASLDKLICLP